MLSNIALQLKKLKKRTNVVIHMGRTLEGPFCSHFSVGRMEIKVCLNGNRPLNSLVVIVEKIRDSFIDKLLGKRFSTLTRRPRICGYDVVSCLGYIVPSFSYWFQVVFGGQ